MLFHLFRKYPDACFVIIADYKEEVLREYLSSFSDVKYLLVKAEGTGTCGGLKQAMELLPENERFMLIWSDLILPNGFDYPVGYRESDEYADVDYVGLSSTFPCRWKYENDRFIEERSTECGVAGFFLFTEKFLFHKFACFRNCSALSVCSHGRSTSVRPK